MASPYSKLPPAKQYLDLSLWPVPVATAFVRALRALPICSTLRPEFFVLCGLAASTGLAVALTLSATPVWLLLTLMFARATFDVIDGMWARATNTVTPLGALLDLSADFIGNALIFASLGVQLSRATSAGWAIPVTLLTFVLAHVAMTFYSMALFFYQHDGELPVSRFIEGDFGADPTRRLDRALFPPLVFIYRLSWRVFAIAVFRFSQSRLGFTEHGPRAPIAKRTLSLLSIFGLASHMLYLAACALFLAPYSLLYVECALGFTFFAFIASPIFRVRRSKGDTPPRR